MMVAVLIHKIFPDQNCQHRQFCGHVIKTANASSFVDGFGPRGRKYLLCIFLNGPKSAYKTATVCSFVNIPNLAGPTSVHRTAIVGRFGNVTIELLALVVLIQDFLVWLCSVQLVFKSYRSHLIWCHIDLLRP